MITLLIIFIITAAIAVALTFLIPTPNESEMSRRDNAITSIRNTFLNIAVCAFGGVLLWFIVNIFQVFLFERKAINGEKFNMSLILSSVIIWLLIMMDRIRVTPSNSVLRTINIFLANKRDIRDSHGVSQGMVDSSWKYRGGTLCVTSVFEQFLGIVETESRENVKIRIGNLRFSDDNGDGEIVTSYKIDDVDAYAANGDTPELRLQKVSDTISARLKSMVEIRTSGISFKKSVKTLAQISRDISDEFVRQTTNLEIRLGIRIQFVELTNFNESQEHKDAHSSKAAAAILRKEAAALLKIAISKGDTSMDLGRATEVVLAVSGNAKRNQLVLDARGLENLHSVYLGGGIPGINPKTPTKNPNKKTP